jgi:hypothetical protein
LNKVLIILALIADVALVANVVHHWDNKPQINIGVECFHTDTKKLNCVIRDETVQTSARIDNLPENKTVRL